MKKIFTILFLLTVPFVTHAASEVELIKNGGFEEGANYWEGYNYSILDNDFSAYSSAHGGENFAYLYYEDLEYGGSLSQTFVLPSNTKSLTLDFFRDVYVEEIGYGSFSVSISRGDDTLYYKSFRNSDYNGWENYSEVLTKFDWLDTVSFAELYGQELTIQFYALEYWPFDVAADLDDVSLIASSELPQEEIILDEPENNDSKVEEKSTKKKASIVKVGKPRKLKINKKSDKVILKWKKIKKAKYYKVHLRTKNGKPVRKWEKVQNTKTVVKHSVIKADKNYKLRVKACRDKKCGQWSKYKEFKTKKSNNSSELNNQAGYQKIFKFKGNGTKQSESFTISGNHFKVKYSCGESGYCGAILYNAESGVYEDLLVNTTDSIKDETIIYKTGKFYIDAIMTGNFSMTVYDYK